jgi:Fe2+ or Zn2+ uptake regulation protein
VKTPEELAAMFRAQGRKLTPQRIAVFRALHGSTTHPTAESVWDEVRVELPSVSLRTVYQTLNDLAQMGELQQLDLGTGSHRFDPHLEAHDHFVCEQCGAVFDLEPGSSDPEAVARLGHQVERTQIIHRGRCRDCVAGLVTT